MFEKEVKGKWTVQSKKTFSSTLLSWNILHKVSCGKTLVTYAEAENIFW